jgi:hypothetical protein
MVVVVVGRSEEKARTEHAVAEAGKVAARTRLTSAGDTTNPPPPPLPPPPPPPRMATGVEGAAAEKGGDRLPSRAATAANSGRGAPAGFSLVPVEMRCCIDSSAQDVPDVLRVARGNEGDRLSSKSAASDRAERSRETGEQAAPLSGATGVAIVTFSALMSKTWSRECARLHTQDSKCLCI